MSNDFYARYPHLRPPPPAEPHARPGAPRPPGPQRPQPPGMAAIAVPSPPHQYAWPPPHPHAPFPPEMFAPAPPEMFNDDGRHGHFVRPPLPDPPPPQFEIHELHDVPHPQKGQTRGELHEGQREWPELDALRWGDADATASPAAVGVAFLVRSKQLIRTHVPRPVVWMVQVNVDQGVQVPAGEANNITVTFLITIGCGQSRTTLAPIVLLTAANGYEPPAPPAPLNIPAQDIQVAAIITYLPTVAGQVVIPCAAMAAPWAHMPYGEARERGWR
jgi:hypothetical protein